MPPTLTEDDFRIYFETYGNVTDVAIMYDQQTNRPRGFGFISFDSEDAVDRVLHKAYHDLSGKQVEVKRALPKDSNSGFGGRSTGNGGSGMGGGSYQGYGDNPSSYDRMDTNRYMQSQNTGGGYPSYGSSGYGTAGYGYGSSNNGMGYGAYGSYGGANPGYGVSILDMVVLQVLPLEIQMCLVPVMVVVKLVDQEARGALRFLLDMVIWAMVMYPGVLQVLVVEVGLLTVDLLLASLQLEPQDMEIKVMAMVDMAEMMGLMEVVHREICNQVEVTWAVAMAMLVEIHKVLVIMVLSKMDLMVVVPQVGRLNNTDHSGQFHPRSHLVT